jgi:Domain of unknown function (DUF6484)
MRRRDTVMEKHTRDDTESVLSSPVSADALGPLLRERPSTPRSNQLPEVVIGELVAVIDNGLVPLVLYPGQPGTAAVRARSVVDIRNEHIRKAVVLVFENGSPELPIVMGVLRGDDNRPLNAPGQVQVDADGERMIVSAKEELVLRCGKASITLTKAGKVIIDGSYVVSRSSGTNRIKGGSVQLN